MQRILLIPAFNMLQQRIEPYVPLGLLSLQAVAQRNGCCVDVFIPDDHLLNTKFENSRQLVDAVVTNIDIGNYDTVGLSTLCSSFHHSLQIARRIKDSAPEIKLLMGGPHASAVGEDILRHFKEIDAVFEGEAELSFERFIQSNISNWSDLHLIPGLRTRNGRSAAACPINNLDELPRIDEAKDYMTAYNLVRNFAGRKDIPIEAARGCNGLCSYCSTRRIWGTRVRRKSPLRLITEMRHLQRLTNYSVFNLIGDNFANPLPPLLDFCAAMAQEEPTIEWGCSFRLDKLRPQHLEAVWQGGCRAFFVGVESSSQETINRIGKRVDLQQELATIRAAISMGFRVTTSFMIGFPWETSDDVKRTFALHCDMLKSGVYSSQVHIVCPIPGTDLLSNSPILFDQWTSGVALDDIPSEDEEIKELARIAPEIFFQMGHYQTPHLKRIELKATYNAAELLAALHSRELIGGRNDERR